MLLLSPLPLSISSATFKVSPSGERDSINPRTRASIRAQLSVTSSEASLFLSLESTSAVTTSWKPLLHTSCLALHCVVCFNEEVPWRHESCLIYTQFSEGIHTTFDFSGFFIFLDVNWEFHMLLCCAVLSQFNRVWLFVTLWTIARQAPLLMGFSRQEYWSGLLCPPPRDLPNLGIEPTFPAL